VVANEILCFCHSYKEWGDKWNSVFIICIRSVMANGILCFCHMYKECHVHMTKTENSICHNTPYTYDKNREFHLPQHSLYIWQKQRIPFFMTGVLWQMEFSVFVICIRSVVANGILCFCHMYKECCGKWNYIFNICLLH
jgi:hypothetical protein